MRASHHCSLTASDLLDTRQALDSPHFETFLLLRRCLTRNKSYRGKEEKDIHQCLLCGETAEKGLKGLPRELHAKPTYVH